MDLHSCSSSAMEVIRLPSLKTLEAQILDAKWVNPEKEKDLRDKSRTTSRFEGGRRKEQYFCENHHTTSKITVSSGRMLLRPPHAFHIFP